jgi:rhamnosyl/mannosyltransferase
VRILQVYRDYFTKLPGGIERHVHDLAHGLSDLGTMEVLASSRGPRTVTTMDGDVKVRLVREFGRPGGIPLSPGFPRVVRQRPYDLIHNHTPNPTGEFATRIAPGGAARVVTYHADLHRARRVYPLYRRFLERYLASCDRVLVSSERLIGSSPVLSTVQGRRPGLVQVIPFGVDTTRFDPAPTEHSEALRASWGEGPVVLFVGRLRYYKGLTVLIEAMERVAATLVVVGEGAESGPVSAAGRQVLGPRFVHVSGVADEVLPDYYRAADVFCLPSINAAETFGIAALEAMASGLPVISTEVGTATSEVNVDGTTGLVVPPRDAGALAAAIEKLVGDEGLATGYGRAAAERASSDFSKDAMLAAVRRVYEQVTEEKRQ